jgi:RimJ/RimL family protein N-acetyltransferase
MGVPFLTIILAENQARVVRALEAHGLTWNLGEGREISPNYLAIVLTEFLNSRETLVQFSERGKHLVDGSGTARIAMHLCGDRLWLRGAKEGDCRQLWEWANDPVVRQASFHPAPILIEDHKTWFFRKLSDPDCFLFIAMDREDQPVGQIRFDLVNEGAEVDYSIDRRFRGKGLGLHLLLAGLDALRRRIRINTVKGYVKKGNLPSIRSFERAGFVTRGMKEIEGSEAIEFIRDL